MNKSRTWKQQRHTAKAQRRAAKTRQQRTAFRDKKFAWVMSLEDGKTTMPAHHRLTRHFGRPVINRNGKILQPTRWFTRRNTDAKEAA